MLASSSSSAERPSCRVEFVADGIVRDVPFGTLLQDLVRDLEVSLLFGCRRGTCGTCLVRVEGETSPATRLEQETVLILGAEPGDRLACRLVVIGDLKISPASST